MCLHVEGRQPGHVTNSQSRAHGRDARIELDTGRVLTATEVRGTGGDLPGVCQPVQNKKVGAVIGPGYTGQGCWLTFLRRVTDWWWCGGGGGGGEWRWGLRYGNVKVMYIEFK